MRFLLTLLLLLSGVADAATFGSTSAIGAPGKSMSTSAPSGFDRRTAFICIVPDIQNLTSKDIDHNGPGDDETTCSCGGGSAGSCPTNDSPWCHDTWRSTHSTMLRNLAYELTGQLDKIEWSFDTALNLGPIGRGDIATPTSGVPRACDMVIQVGDIGDSGHPYDSTDAFGTIPEAVRGEWTVAWNDFFLILKAAGVPFIAAHGNHDATMAYKQYFSETEIQSLPGFVDIVPSYSTGATNAAWSIKADTPAGEICAVTWGCKADKGSLQWFLDSVGCGDSLPTIVVSHNGWWGEALYSAGDATCREDATTEEYWPDYPTGITQTGTAATLTVTLAASETITEALALGASYFSIIIDGAASPRTCGVTSYNPATKVLVANDLYAPGNCVWAADPDADDVYYFRFETPFYAMYETTDLVFATAYGHQTSTLEACHPCAGTITNRATSSRTASGIYIPDNWQEWNRVGNALAENGGFGSSASDGMAGFYTIMVIEPERDKISVRPWSTTYQSTNPHPSSGFTDNWHQPQTFSLDWCTRYLGGAC